MVAYHDHDDVGVCDFGLPAENLTTSYKVELELEPEPEWKDGKVQDARKSWQLSDVDPPTNHTKAPTANCRGFNSYDRLARTAAFWHQIALKTSQRGSGKGSPAEGCRHSNRLDSIASSQRDGYDSRPEKIKEWLNCGFWSVA